jgi:hypothetical protein
MRFVPFHYSLPRQGGEIVNRAIAVPTLPNDPCPLQRMPASLDGDQSRERTTVRLVVGGSIGGWRRRGAGGLAAWLETLAQCHEAASVQKTYRGYGHDWRATDRWSGRGCPAVLVPPTFLFPLPRYRQTQAGGHPRMLNSERSPKFPLERSRPGTLRPRAISTTRSGGSVPLPSIKHAAHQDVSRYD